MGVIVALMLTNCYGTARFPSVKHKASSNAFSIHKVPHPQPHPKVDFGRRTIAKIRKFLQNKRKMEKNVKNLCRKV